MMSARDSFITLPSSSPLRDAALVAGTHRAYSNNLNRFLQYTRLSLSSLIQLPVAQIDARLATYFDYQFAHQGSYHNANHTLNGLVYRYPALKLHLGESRMRLRGWSNSIVEESHPPITWDLTVLLATVMAKWGHHAEAVGALLSFDCYLRVSELTQLRYSDVLMPHDPRAGSVYQSMALRLGVTKTGREQSVSVDNPAVVSALCHYMSAFPFLRDDLIFPFSSSTFRHLITRVADAVGLGHVHYVPHSFRHGGATHDSLKKFTIEQIMFRGRWKSMESARRYVQTCRALLIRQEIPAHLHELGKVLSTHVPAIMQLLLESVARRGRRVRFRLKR